MELRGWRGILLGGMEVGRGVRNSLWNRCGGRLVCILRYEVYVNRFPSCDGNAQS